jgi:phenylalanyl-tRNA synthetase beta chain
MNVSTRWLKDMVDGLEGTPEELADHLALRGAPVEDISSPGASLGDVVIARVVSAQQHPNADRLSVCEVDGGDGLVQVVCGAPNVKGGAYYPFAPVGAVLPGDFKIKKAKIRGEVSQGMLCSAKELELGGDHDGILELQGEFTPGEAFVPALGLDDATLDVEVTSNRGDLLSHVGIARELASEGHGSVVLPAIPGDPGLTLDYVVDPARVTAGDVSIQIDDPDLCTQYLGAVIRGVTVGPSPAWLQERLRGAGARPINNVVDATNYVMLELGQPLHAFDLNRLAGPGIVVRRAGASEPTFTTLDDEKRDLTTEMLMICDADRPVAIAGVMGGLDSEVSDDTTDVLLECALFDPKSIRATRKALVMSTDASYRYERGVDPENLRRAVERCAAIIVATAGGEVDGPVLDCCPVTFEPQTVDLRLSRIERLLGIPFEADYVTELLTPLGLEVQGQSEGTLHVRVPGYRSYDVTREVDLIEEVARTHGYDAFPDHLGPARPGSVPDHPLFLLEDELRAAMAARGFFEAHTPAFAPPGEGDVEVANPR